MNPPAPKEAVLTQHVGIDNASHGSGLCRFLAIDERENFIKWSQTTTGRLIIYFTAIVAVATYFPWWETTLVVSAAMAASYAPKFRNSILFTATWSAAFLEMGLAENSILKDIGAVMQHATDSNGNRVSALRHDRCLRGLDEGSPESEVLPGPPTHDHSVGA